MRAWFCLVLVVGCYHASAQPGLPCSEDGSCPGGQTCDQTLSPPTCLETVGDAGVPDPDAVDAPPQACSLGCTGTTPFCDEPTQICRGCIADAECSSDVCHELTGECVPEGHALYVAPSGNGASCTRNSPCSKIDDAAKQRTAQRYTIKLADGRYAERLELKVENNLGSIVISGPDRTWDGPEIVANLNGNRIDQNMIVVIEGVSILDTPQDGLECFGSVTLSHVLVRNSGDTGIVGRGPVTRILDSRIEQSASSGVVVMSGAGEIERTVITDNANGGVRIESGVGYSILNSIIATNGTVTAANAGVRILGSAPPGGAAVFRFNTVANNLTQLPEANAFYCGRPVTIESSIVANPTGFLQNELTAMCSAQSSLFGESTPPAMGGNLMGDPMFVSATDFHVLPGSAAVDAAPVAGAPLLDVDGQLRAGVDPPDIGADEVP